MQRAWILVTSRMEADNDLFQFSRNHQRSEEQYLDEEAKNIDSKLKVLDVIYNSHSKNRQDFMKISIIVTKIK